MSRALLICLLTSLSAAPVLAQTAPPPPISISPTGPTFAGPVVPGVCYFGLNSAIAASKVGQAATARLQQLALPLRDQISAQGQPLETENKQLLALKPTLKASEYQARQQALLERYNSWRQMAAQRESQLQATRLKAFNQIASQAGSALEDAYKAHGCGVLFDRGALIGGNMTNDLTASVTAGLDAKVTTITFDLEPPTSASGAQAQ